MDICRHIVAASAASDLLLVCTTGPTPSLYSSKQQIDIVFESECCKSMFRVFQMFQRYVASVSYGCCKNRSGCFVCYNDCTLICKYCSTCFICFSNVCYKCVYLDVTYVSHIHYKCFIWMLHVFQWFSSVFRCFCMCFSRMFQVFQAHVSSIHLSSHICCKCFI
jgi:hypothetical protein